VNKVGSPGREKKKKKTTRYNQVIRIIQEGGFVKQKPKNGGLYRESFEPTVQRRSTGTVF